MENENKEPDFDFEPQVNPQEHCEELAELVQQLQFVQDEFENMSDTAMSLRFELDRIDEKLGPMLYRRIDFDPKTISTPCREMVNKVRRRVEELVYDHVDFVAACRKKNVREMLETVATLLPKGMKKGGGEVSDSDKDNPDHL